MKGVELYAQVRYAVQIDGLSPREAARRFGIDPGASTHPITPAMFPDQLSNLNALDLIELES